MNNLSYISCLIEKEYENESARQLYHDLKLTVQGDRTNSFFLVLKEHKLDCKIAKHVLKEVDESNSNLLTESFIRHFKSDFLNTVFEKYGLKS